MSLYKRLNEALHVLEQELNKDDLITHLLRIKLTCVKCNKSSADIQGIKIVWTCKVHGVIPDEYLNAACDSWELSRR